MSELLDSLAIRNRWYDDCDEILYVLVIQYAFSDFLLGLLKLQVRVFTLDRNMDLGIGYRVLLPSPACSMWQ